MTHHWLIKALFAAVFWTIMATGNAFAAGFVERVQSHLYAGQTEKAASVAKARLAEVADDGQVRFALGAIQFLQSVERLGQSLYRYGLQSGDVNTFGLAGLPIFRIPVPTNPNPDEITYDALREILQSFINDLTVAEATLDQIKAKQIDLPLNIGLIRLDLNNDGEGSDEEALWQIFKVVASARWLNEQAANQLLVDFDASDVPWLQAYCHLLMAIAEFPLAHDWQEAFDATFTSLFPMPSSRYRKLGEWDKQDETLSKRFMRRSDEAGIADLVAFIHLNHWPVIERQRMSRALKHLQAMVQLSRLNWSRIRAETDNRAEWIPNPQQTGALPGIAVSQEQVVGWMAFLDEFEAILQGKKLVPHWRFDEGINLRRLLLEVETFDIVLLLQGSAAVPYLENGEQATGETWNRMQQIFEGNFFRYFVWFN